ncbi:MAG: hypothetical protein LBK94_12870 [Prevotellaceae bacterium]|nr:hypothetical protein [Prevotellaceae bacterium]
MQAPVTIYVHYSEAAVNSNVLDKLLIENFTVKIICEIDKDLNGILSLLKDKPYQYSFLIKNEEEYAICEQIAENLTAENYAVIPVFDNNLQFFEDNVFLDKDDVLASGLGKREIFAHQAVNTNFFGDLIVLPDGKVYANINGKPIGTIENSVYDLIIQALDDNNSWRFIRNEKPCTDCLLHWLCPSPSNYERVIGKMNLCNMKQE